MPGSLIPQKSRATVFTLQEVNSNTMVNGPATDVSGKWGGTVKIRFGRTSSTSIGAVEFRLAGTGLGVAGGNTYWVPIYAWTTANHGTTADQPAVTSTPAANASALDGTWTSITVSDGLVMVYDSNTANRSEWTRVLSVTGSMVTFTNTLTNIHTATTNEVISQAEEWNIPVDLSSEEEIRMTVDTAKNSVAVPVVVQAILVTHDATYYS